MTLIGDGVFSDCRSLTQIELPGSLVSVGSAAFNSCESLTHIELPGGVTWVGNMAFISCDNLTKVTFAGSTAPALGINIFENCNKLEAIHIPAGATGYDSGNWPADKIMYTVTVQAGPGGSAGASRDFAARGMRVTLTAAPDKGFRFKEWQVVSGGVSLGGDEFVMPAGDVTVRAVFEAEPEAAGGNGGSSGSGSSGSSSGGGSVTYDTLVFETNGGNHMEAVSRPHGMTIDLAGYVPVREGYDFGGWYADRGLTRRITQIRLDGARAVYAGWKESALTRAGAALIFYRLKGRPLAVGEGSFPDVEYGPDTVWYYGAMAWARRSGVMSGCEDGLFRPDDPVTREQLALAFYRYARYKGYDVTAAGGLQGFPDGDTVSEWAQEALTWAAGSGIIGVGADGTLDPQGTVTISEAAEMLNRFMERNGPAPASYIPGDGGMSGDIEGTADGKTLR